MRMFGSKRCSGLAAQHEPAGKSSRQSSKGRPDERRVAARRRAECDRIAGRPPPAPAIINRSIQRIRYI